MQPITNVIAEHVGNKIRLEQLLSPTYAYWRNRRALNNTEDTDFFITDVKVSFDFGKITVCNIDYFDVSRLHQDAVLYLSGAEITYHPTLSVTTPNESLLIINTLTALFNKQWTTQIEGSTNGHYVS